VSKVSSIGIDAGSTTCKLVAIDCDGAIVGSRLEPTEPRVEIQMERMLAALRDELEAGPEAPVIATGYGRKLIKEATRNVTEITCHARGVFRALGRAGTLIDIGGQDSKVIQVGDNGRPVDFMMNDKCAAGTGRFLEHTAARLGVPVDQLGGRALSARGEEAITSTCTVFAESEIISLIARGADPDSILRGLHRSLVGRVISMVRNVGIVTPLMLSGGVARNDAVRTMIAEAASEEVVLPGEPQLMGAYGAALLGGTA